MSIEIEKYYRYFVDYDLTDAERDDCIRSSLGALENLIDSMEATHPVAQALVDKQPKRPETGALRAPDVVELKDDILTEVFKETAKPKRKAKPI